MELVAEKNERVNMLIEPTGDVTTKQFRVFATRQQNSETDDPASKHVSMWHDVPLYPHAYVVNMICEVH